MLSDSISVLQTNQIKCFIQREISIFNLSYTTIEKSEYNTERKCWIWYVTHFSDRR